MPMYTLELELFSSYVTDVPEFEIWADGVLLGGTTYSVTSGGFSISVNPSYGGALPTSLEFRFNDVSVEAPRSIEIRSVKINNQYVNTGNYLSSKTLVNGGNSIVDIDSVDTDDSDFIFDSSEPAASEFTTGATNTFTAGVDFHNNYNGTTDEIFNMLAGSDYAHTGSGDDKIAGGSGNDVLRGGSGNDLIFGGADNDRLFGMNDDDTIYGGTGNDTLFGNNGNDELHGGDGNDKISGHSGDDILTGGIGEDKLNGGSGVDFLFGGDNNDSLVGGSGNDTLDGGAGEDLIYGGANDDIINGGDDNDVLIGNIGVDEIHGDDGDDTIYIMTNDWSAGEAIYGGVGTDELILSHASTVDFTTGTLETLEALTGSNGDQDVTIEINQLGQFTTVDLGGHTTGDTIRTQIDGVYDAVTNGVPTVTNVENGFLVGSASADTLTVSETELSNLIYGTGTINMGGSTDILNLTETSATLNGLGTTDGDIVGLEEVDASTAAAAVTVDFDSQTENFILTGSTNNDILTTGDGDDTINGGDGDDTVNGGDGIDVLNGEDGNDAIIGGDGDDTLNGGNGDDILSGDLATYNYSDGLLVLEAENFSSNVPKSGHEWEIVTDATASAGSSVYVDNNGGGNAWVSQAAAENNSPELNYTVNFDATGTYYVWVRGDAPNGGDDSVHIGFNGVRQTDDGGVTGFTGGYNWGGASTYGGTRVTLNVVTTGDHTFNLWAREDGVTVDKLLITDDISYTPTGSGPAESIQNSASGGDDIINGGAGNDVIQGDIGTDTLDGGVDDDTLIGGADRDTITGGAGLDSIILSNGDFVTGESIDGGADTDELILADSTTVDFTIGTLTSLETLIGSDGNDDVTIDGITLNQFTSIDFSIGTDVLRLNATSTGLNSLVNGSLSGLETINVSAAASGVIVDLSSQTEDFTIIGNDNNTVGSNLLLNGGFEDTSNGTGNGVTPPNWTTIGTGWGVYAFGGGRGSEGTYSVPLGGWTGATGGGVSQAVATTVGNIYSVTFDAGVNFGGATRSGVLQVMASDGGTTNVSAYITDDGSVTGLDTYSYNFVATGVSTTFSFEFISQTGGDVDFDIDNIIVQEITADSLIGGAGDDTITGDLGDDNIVGAAGDDALYGDGTAVATETSVQGWSYQYYDLPFMATPDLNGAGFTLNGGRDHNLGSTTAGTASDFTPAVYDTGDDYALKFETTLTITTAGTYTFRTNSDDGSQLFLDGALIVNNDGLHGNVTVTGAGQVLAAGTYTLELTFFERSGGNVLGADISGPDTGNVFVGLATYAGANVVTQSGSGTDGDDIINGGAGTDTLYGGGGADTFIFEAASAFAQTDTIMDFSTTDGDRLDISDLITGAFSGNIKEYLQFTSDGATGDTLVQVDANGTTGGTSFQTIARLDGIVGMDEVTLYNAGDIII